jgi:hypothetical protein
MFYNKTVETIIDFFALMGVFAFGLGVTIFLGCVLVVGMVAIIGIYVGLN